MITGDFEGSFLRALVEGSGQLPYTATVQSPLEIPPTKTFDFFLVPTKKKQTNLSSILPSSSLFLSHYFHFPFPREKKKKEKFDDPWFDHALFYISISFSMDREEREREKESFRISYSFFFSLYSFDPFWAFWNYANEFERISFGEHT